MLFHRFEKIVDTPVVQRFLRIGKLTVSAQNHETGVGKILPANRFQQFKSGHFWHHNVGDDKVNGQLFYVLQSLLSVGQNGSHFIACGVPVNQRLQTLRNKLLIIYDNNF